LLYAFAAAADLLDGLLHGRCGFAGLLPGVTHFIVLAAGYSGTILLASARGLLSFLCHPHSSYWTVGTFTRVPSSNEMSTPLSEALEMLSKACKFVVDGERFVSRQKAYVDKLENKGLDTSNAEEYLEILEDMQGKYVDHLYRLEQQVLYLVKPE
jgi:hypothetical protein